MEDNTEATKWRLNLVLIALIALLTSVMAVVGISTLAYYIDNKDVRAALPLLPVRRPADVDFAKILVCVYNVRAARKDFRRQAKDVPPRYCNYIVVCCAKSLTDDFIWNAVAVIRRNVPSRLVVLGLAASTKGAWFQAAMAKSKNLTGLVDKVTSSLGNHDIGGGLFVNMPRYDDRTPQINFRIVVKLLAKKLRDERQVLFISLPTDESMQARYVTKHMLRYGALFVKTTHFTNPVYKGSNQTICTTSLRLPKAYSSVDGGIKSIRNARFGWPLRSRRNPGPYATDLRKRTLFTFDLGCYEFSTENSLLPPVHLGKVRSYEKFCKARSDKTVAWNAYEDPKTMCRALSSKNVMWTVSNPKVVEEMKSTLSNQFAGLVLFNIHLDDFRCACSKEPFSFTKQVYCVLQGLKEVECKRLP